MSATMRRRSFAALAAGVTACLWVPGARRQASAAAQTPPRHDPPSASPSPVMVWLWRHADAVPPYGADSVPDICAIADVPGITQVVYHDAGGWEAYTRQEDA
jgi:hypothetical protein